MKVDNTNVFTAIELIIEQIDEMKQTIMLISRPAELAEATSHSQEPLDLDEVCRLTKKARSTIYRHCSQGEMPCYKNGKKLYFFRDEVMEWIRKNKKKSSIDYMEEAERMYSRRRSHAV